MRMENADDSADVVVRSFGKIPTKLWCIQTYRSHVPPLAVLLKLCSMGGVLGA